MEQNQITSSHEMERNYNALKASFIMRGSSLNAWCIENEVAPANVRKAFSGVWTGPKASALIQLLCIEAGLKK